MALCGGKTYASGGEVASFPYLCAVCCAESAAERIENYFSFKLFIIKDRSLR